MWTGGFSFGPGQPGLSPYGGTGVDRIRITNAGAKSLFVDAVIGYGFKEEKNGLAKQACFHLRQKKAPPRAVRGRACASARARD